MIIIFIQKFKEIKRENGLMKLITVQLIYAKILIYNIPEIIVFFIVIIILFMKDSSENHCLSFLIKYPLFC